MRDFANFHDRDILAEIPRVAGIALLAGVAFSLIGPFGTDVWAVFARLGFWTAMSAGWFAITFVVAELLARSQAARHLEKRWRWALLFVASLVPATLVSAFSLNILGRWSWTQGEVLDLIWHAALIGLVLEGVSIALSRRAEQHRGEEQVLGVDKHQADDAASAPIGDVMPPVGPPLVKRLPLEARGPIVCLQMEDHYVRVHTQETSTLILMRFSEALAEVGDGNGMRVHRSWWVANDAIRSIERKGRTARIRLSNTLEVPVSQPYLEAVAAIEEHQWQHGQ